MSFKALSDSIVGLCNDVFGDSYSYTPNEASPVSIKAVFGTAWVDVEGTVSLKKTLRIRLSDLPSEPAKGDMVTIEEVDYRVMESHEDGHGGSTLILQKD